MAPKTVIYKWIFPIFLVLLSTVAILNYPRKKEPVPQPPSMHTVSGILAGATEGYERAIMPRRFEFPRDHGPHPDFRNEWWYFSGNLKTTNNRHFGYQFTLFRTSLSPNRDSRSSRWATRQVYMGHFALTDTQLLKHHQFERFSRAALQLAGARASPFRVWLENWSVRSVGKSFFPLRIQVSEGNVSLNLELTPQKDLVLQGEEGLSRKGEESGNASYYYSFTRLRTKGRLQVGDQEYALEGLSWMDREWSSSALQSNQVGWDWIALQLSNGWDLMIYQMRLKDGRIDPASSGLLVSPHGESHPLSARQIDLQNFEYWQSAVSGIRYPSRWNLLIPQYDVNLDLVPFLDEQEFRASLTYWEGAVHGKGTFRSQPVQGNGYVELTGYPSLP